MKTQTDIALQDISARLKRGQEAEALLYRVLDWALANRGTTSEFVTCYTYGKSYPRTLVDVKKFFREPLRKGYKVVADRGSKRQGRR